jgi:signal transduction histidine kinase
VAVKAWPRAPLRDRHGVPREERERVRRNLAVTQWAAVAGGLLGIVSALVTPNLQSALVLATGMAVVVVSMEVRRRGRLRLSALLFLLCLITVIHTLGTLGRGIHDTATMLYPLAILIAALMLDRRLLVATTVACITSVTILVARETPGSPDWALVFDAGVILVVSAVAVYLLVADVVRGMAKARSKERRLAEAYRDLDVRNAELERFTYVVSHDLKSPLVTIRGFLDYAEQDARAGDLERMATDVERIRVATERMGRLLDDLLELSRTGRIAREPEEVAFGQIVQEARALVEGRLAERGVRVDVDETAARCVVHGDRARLVELMQNLIDNAAKFSEGQENPTVTIGLREDASAGPAFTVSDNGVGIEPAHQERVFDLFQKLDPSAEGHGLGLALVRRIVESHHGRIWVESEGRGQGATFCFTLPRRSGPA